MMMAALMVGQLEMLLADNLAAELGIVKAAMTVVKLDAQLVD